jgi:hypothetical protein
MGFSVGPIQAFEADHLVLEEGVVVHVHVAFDGEIIRNENVVALQLDVVITHFIDVDRGDCRAVDEIGDRNQNLAEIQTDRMPARKEKILRRAVGPKCVGDDPQEMAHSRIGKQPAADVAMADPFDRPRLPGTGQDEVADLQRLHRDVALGPANRAACDKAFEYHAILAFLRTLRQESATLTSRSHFREKLEAGHGGRG